MQELLLEVKLILASKRRIHWLNLKQLKMRWQVQLMVEQLQLMVEKAVDRYLLIGMIGMIQNILKNKGRHLLISKRNKKILSQPLEQRKRRRSLRKRRSLEPQAEMFSMLMSMMVPQSINILVSMLLKNLTWMKNKTVTDMKKKKSRKIWAKPELNKIEANLMLQAWTIKMTNHIIWMISSEEISIINQIIDKVYQVVIYNNMIVLKDLNS